MSVAFVARNTENLQLMVKSFATLTFWIISLVLSGISENGAGLTLIQSLFKRSGKRGSSEHG